MAATFCIHTFGCKVNWCDSEALAAELQQTGWGRVAGDRVADVHIVNTCGVTGKAAAQCRQLIRRLAREQTRSRIVVTGCYARIDQQQLAAINGVDAVLDQEDPTRIADLLSRRFAADLTPQGAGQPLMAAIEAPGFAPGKADSADSRTRPFLKVQDGCDSFCAYCIVPHARGRSRSVSLETVVTRFNALKRAGFREVVLTGIHLGHYGRDLNPAMDLDRLLATLEPLCDGIRIRLSSIEPCELSPAILDRVAASNAFCHHFHVPLQSADDLILARMRRPYTHSQYADLVATIVQKMPDAAIGADILVGFPGEDETAFTRTLQFVQDLPLAYLHVFPFSVRPGTPAAEFEDQVAPDVIKQRCQDLRSVDRLKRQTFYRRYLQRALDVVIETTRDSASDLLKGISSNYIPILLPGDDSLKNQRLFVNVMQVDKDNRVYGSF